MGNRLQDNLVNKNVVNLSRRNLTDSEISLLSKGVNFQIPTSSAIDKAKLKTKLDAQLEYYDQCGILEMKKTSLTWKNLSQNLLLIRVITMQPMKYTGVVWRKN